jgi:hypothetical protein
VSNVFCMIKQANWNQQANVCHIQVRNAGGNLWNCKESVAHRCS